MTLSRASHDVRSARSKMHPVTGPLQPARIGAKAISYPVTLDVRLNLSAQTKGAEVSLKFIKILDALFFDHYKTVTILFASVALI